MSKTIAVVGTRHDFSIFIEEKNLHKIDYDIAQDNECNLYILCSNIQNVLGRQFDDYIYSYYPMTGSLLLYQKMQQILEEVKLRIRSQDTAQVAQPIITWEDLLYGVKAAI